MVIKYFDKHPVEQGGLFILDAAGDPVPIKSGATPLPVSIEGSNATGYESLNVTNGAAVALAAVPASATRATITVEDAEIRVRWDGTAPTTAQGHLAEPFDEIVLLNRMDILNAKFIATTATAANLRVTHSA